MLVIRLMSLLLVTTMPYISNAQRDGSNPEECMYTALCFMSRGDLFREVKFDNYEEYYEMARPYIMQYNEFKRCRVRLINQHCRDMADICMAKFREDAVLLLRVPVKLVTECEFDTMTYSLFLCNDTRVPSWWPVNITEQIPPTYRVCGVVCRHLREFTMYHTERGKKREDFPTSWFEWIKAVSLLGMDRMMRMAAETRQVSVFSTSASVVTRVRTTAVNVVARFSVIQSKLSGVKLEEDICEVNSLVSSVMDASYRVPKEFTLQCRSYLSSRNTNILNVGPGPLIPPDPEVNCPNYLLGLEFQIPANGSVQSSRYLCSGQDWTYFRGATNRTDSMIESFKCPTNSFVCSSRETRDMTLREIVNFEFGCCEMPISGVKRQYGQTGVKIEELTMRQLTTSRPVTTQTRSSFCRSGEYVDSAKLNIDFVNTNPLTILHRIEFICDAYGTSKSLFQTPSAILSSGLNITSAGNSPYILECPLGWFEGGSMETTSSEFIYTMKCTNSSSTTVAIKFNDILTPGGSKFMGNTALKIGKGSFECGVGFAICGVSEELKGGARVLFASLHGAFLTYFCCPIVLGRCHDVQFGVVDEPNFKCNNNSCSVTHSYGYKGVKKRYFEISEILRGIVEDANAVGFYDTFISIQMGPASWSWIDAIRLSSSSSNEVLMTKIFNQNLPFDFQVSFSKPTITCGNVMIYSDDVVASVRLNDKCVPRQITEQIGKSNGTGGSFSYKYIPGVFVPGLTFSERYNILPLNFERDLQLRFVRELPPKQPGDLIWRGVAFYAYNALRIQDEITFTIPFGHNARFFHLYGMCGGTRIYTSEFRMESKMGLLTGPVNKSNLVEPMVDACREEPSLEIIPGDKDSFKYIDEFYGLNFRLVAGRDPLIPFCSNDTVPKCTLSYGALSLYEGIGAAPDIPITFKSLAKQGNERRLSKFFQFEYPWVNADEGDRYTSLINVPNPFDFYYYLGEVSCGIGALGSVDPIAIRKPNLNCKPRDQYVQIPPSTYKLTKTKKGGFNVLNFESPLFYGSTGSRGHVHYDADVGPNQYAFNGLGVSLDSPLGLEGYFDPSAAEKIFRNDPDLLKKKYTDAEWDVSFSSFSPLAQYYQFGWPLYYTNRDLFSVTFPPIPQNHVIRFYRVFGTCDNIRVRLPEVWIQSGLRGSFNPVGPAERSKLIKGKNFKAISTVHIARFNVSTGLVTIKILNPFPIIPTSGAVTT